MVDSHGKNVGHAERPGQRRRPHREGVGDEAGGRRVQDDAAELLDSSAGRGVVGGRGGSERRGRVRSGVARERAEEGGERRERVREVQGVRGVAREVQGDEGARRQGGGGRRVAARAGHAPLPTGARREATGGARWAGPVSWAGYR